LTILTLLPGFIDDIGIVDIINQKMSEHPQQKVSAAHVVKALILNRMGKYPLTLRLQFL
jgi:hypothetical protein